MKGRSSVEGTTLKMKARRRASSDACDASTEMIDEDGDEDVDVDDAEEDDEDEE